MFMKELVEVLVLCLLAPAKSGLCILGFLASACFCFSLAAFCIVDCLYIIEKRCCFYSLLSYVFSAPAPFFALFY